MQDKPNQAGPQQPPESNSEQEQQPPESNGEQEQQPENTTNTSATETSEEENNITANTTNNETAIEEKATAIVKAHKSLANATVTDNTTHTKRYSLWIELPTSYDNVTLRKQITKEIGNSEGKREREQQLNK